MKELTYSCFISVDGAEPVPLESLNEDELREAEKKMSDRLSRNLSAYYSQHPEAYKHI